MEDTVNWGALLDDLERIHAVTMPPVLRAEVLSILEATGRAMARAAERLATETSAPGCAVCAAIRKARGR